MRDVLESILDWYDGGETFGLATVVNTFRSAPRQPGAAMAVSARGEVVGSVSGGCVEGAVFEVARQAIDTGKAFFEEYGYSDDDAFAVGLTCGGIVHVFVEAVNRRTFPELPEIADSVKRHEPVAVATVTSDGPTRGARRVIWGDHTSGSLGSSGLDYAIDDDARGMLAQGRTGQRHYGAHGQRRRDEVAVFVQSFAPPPRMIVFGAIDFAAAVARVGKFLGYFVTVCDARGVFATAKRFPDADEVVVRWPHQYLDEITVDERTAICVLTHDPKFDVPLLEVALRTPAGYVGAMGSRRTHEDRAAKLRAAGVTEEQLARLHSPIGLDLHARTPEETAVSIAAELIQERWGGSGRPLTGTRGRIHGPAH
ncbi:XdhC family protein [Mangrovihabitans endophyticus]|uniref:Xanthine dehydrogenase accessory factor n=1 Tax=Mangrovihabitans endophyticus TaxID=1751298 RepID=A0A8J3BWJ6_9ACTN|nr:XdhC/CoxI family protein [Mangrovihabitans endophyticus]GGK75696.1 xanthine dehydrogenase accessory factor [Mangrovihabitans endophyticus]